MPGTVDKRMLMTSQRFLNRKAYWEKKLSGGVNPVPFFFGTGNGVGAGNRRERVPISFSPGICDRLLALGNRSGLTVYIVLLAALKTVLYRYSGGETTACVSPVYGPNVTDLTLSDLVVIVDCIAGTATFKETLLQVTQSVREAYENQDYPFTELAGTLLQESNIACLSRDIHDPGKIESLTGAVVFSFERKGSQIAGTVTFDPGIYEVYYIEQLSRHFIKTLDAVLSDINIPLFDICFLSEEEKRRLLYDFNDTKTAYPSELTIHELFEKQVEGTPDKTAVIRLESGDGNRVIESVTYRELNEKAGRLAVILREKGVTRDSIVAIMVEPSVPMIYGILGILKAGGAYLPIALDYPDERKRYILADSGAEILLTTRDKGCREQACLFLDVDHCEGPNADPNVDSNSRDLAYVIYTSGSTGSPRGVMVEHKNVVRLVKNTGFVEFNSDHRLLRTGALEFDASTFEIWGALLNGLTLYSASREDILIPGRLKEIVRGCRIDTMWLTSPLFNRLSSEDVEIFDGLKNLIVGGDVLSPSHINRVRRRFSCLNVINGYGPTENTTFSTTFPIRREYEKSIPIGKPISNSTAYILGKSNQLSPIGVMGELVVGGDGVARGYLNNPELTAERFSRGAAPSNFLTPYPLLLTPFYRTGDLARWLPDGSIEFLGRLDNQVKIRGFRIETGEIEHRLLNHESVEEALVVCRENNGDKHLCAYIVGTGGAVDTTELREHLAGSLPDFMIPAFFIVVEAFPLNRNGKIDVRALPEPSPGNGSENLAAPRTGAEKTLVAIWSDVLDIPAENIGIDDNFFELGGHSLKIGILITRIHKAFNVKIELADVFMIQTIRELAEYIEGAETDLYTAIEPAPEKEYYTLSSAQKRLYFLNQRDLNDTGYNMPLVLVLNESVNREKLEVAFRQLIRRHESLRTAFIMIDDTPVQRIYPDVNFQIEYYDIEGKEGGSGEAGWSPHTVKILHDFVKPFDLSRAPLLRVGLIKEAEQSYTMIVDIHHVISDGTSHDVLAREFAALFTGRQLQPLRLRYRDYSEWQKSFAVSETVLKQKEYWLKQFEDNIPVLNLPIDYPRPRYRDAAGVRILTEIPEPLVWKLKRLALNFDTTLYTVLLAGFTLLMARISGQDDIVVGSPVSGRTHADLHPIIGLFANMLPMRNRPREDKTLSDFLGEVKENALSAFENQDFQFDQLVNALKIKRDPGRHPLFDAVLALQNVGSAGEDRKKPESLDNFNVVPYPYHRFDVQHDFLVMAEERGGKLDILLEYAVALFKPETIDEIWNHFIDILEQIVAVENLRSPLKDIRLSHDAVVISQENEEEGDFNF